MLLLSQAEMEGPSDFTRCEPLLLMSRPCNRPRGSFCKISEIGWEFIGCRYWVDMLEWEWWNGGNCMFGWPAGPICWGSERKDDGVYSMCCIPRSNDSEGLIISPVAIFSLSTSCFNAVFRAARYQVLLGLPQGQHISICYKRRNSLDLNNFHCLGISLLRLRTKDRQLDEICTLS